MQRDSPGSDWDGWAEYYDLVAGDRAPMAGFYRSLVGRKTRSLLDLACGTGAITLAVAQRLGEDRGIEAGCRVVGIDASAAMLRFARAKDPRVEWVQGDMSAPPVAGVFDLVLCCYNTVQSLLRDEDLARFLGTVRSFLAPGGLFAFDVMRPDLPYLSGPQREHVARVVTDRSGRCIEHRRKFAYDTRARVLTIDHRLVEHGARAASPLTTLRHQYRQYAAAELQRAVIAADFSVVQRYGDFDRSALEADSLRQIFVCAAPNRISA